MGGNGGTIVISRGLPLMFFPQPFELLLFPFLQPFAFLAGPLFQALAMFPLMLLFTFLGFALLFVNLLEVFLLVIFGRRWMNRSE